MHRELQNQHQIIWELITVYKVDVNHKIFIIVLYYNIHKYE